MSVQILTDKEDSEESAQLLDKPKEGFLARITRLLKHPDIKHDHIDTLQDAVTPSKMPYLDNIDARLEILTHTLHDLDTEIRENPLKYGGREIGLVLIRAVGLFTSRQGRLCHHEVYRPQDIKNSAWSWMEAKDLHEVMEGMHGLDILHFNTIARSQATSLSLMNVISLNDTLSKWWAKSWIALEPIAQTDLSIRLRFRWLREPMFVDEEDHSAGGGAEEEDMICPRTVFLNADPRLNSKEIRSQSGKPLRIVHFKTCEYIEDGYGFDITSEKKEGLPNFGLLEMRYKLSLLISLSWREAGRG
ncbi:hypothetical protein CSAL01_12604 [Colletotrichum salicis]|uniref:Uncharacterized protein n=1 Tax=Colletotrichum salicis TaxID=1209931 RepID=A0A135UWM1_9PEZI|nr:hypothetical protein CSAL01_12604 [Colletotrichum salicis]